MQELNGSWTFGASIRMIMNKLLLALLPVFLCASRTMAQPPCEGLSIVSVTYAPFTDTVIHVVLNNTGGDFVSYPSFLLLDAENDTLAQESVNFFGVGMGLNTHRVDIRPDVELPPAPFPGRLELWTGLGDSIVCAWELSIDLCPTVACHPMLVYAYNSGIPISADLDWSVLDTDGLAVATGVLAIGPFEGYVQDSVCLPAGNYTLYLEGGQPGGTIQYGVAEQYFAMDGLGAPYMQDGNANTMDFPFFAPCVGVGQGVGEGSPEQLTVALTAQGVRVERTDGAPLGNIILMDARGRTVATERSSASTIFFDLRGKASGIYLVQCIGGADTIVPQRVVWP
jgi:hypothetical protein